ncbi:hypothetical protein ZEAMMB73_Zm00001d004135 [Zea mays]|uniref:Uncharacterized protein n=1 Tax=Zea mays TaxID=4577 RepID=A0A1D6EE46_MAIZE|nr:hypothetical protein ZEAMMB73_Zm00001d004135 [Zea mays]
MGLVWNLIELISIVRFGPNWNENGPGLKFSFTLRPRTNPCVVTSGSKPGSTRPTRRRLHATGATAALTRPARRRRTAPTTTLPAAFSPHTITTTLEQARNHVCCCRTGQNCWSWKRSSWITSWAGKSERPGYTKSWPGTVTTLELILRCRTGPKETFSVPLQLLHRYL